MTDTTELRTEIETVKQTSMDMETVNKVAQFLSPIVVELPGPRHRRQAGPLARPRRELHRRARAARHRRAARAGVRRPGRGADRRPRPAGRCAPHHHRGEEHAARDDGRLPQLRRDDPQVVGQIDAHAEDRARRRSRASTTATCRARTSPSRSSAGSSRTAGSSPRTSPATRADRSPHERAAPRDRRRVGARLRTR